jgi:hypothetical protein
VTELPSQVSIRLDELNGKELKSIKAVREAICSAARESFAFLAYKDKVHILKKAFKVKARGCPHADEDEIKKHVVVRNIFQHHRGVVDAGSLGLIGKNTIDLMKDDGTQQSFEERTRIELSPKDISALCKAIENYSEIFEVLS